MVAVERLVQAHRAFAANGAAGAPAWLKELRDGKRPGADTLMSQAVAGLGDADLAALAHFAASR